MKIYNNFYIILFVALIMTINDIFSFSITKTIYKDKKPIYWLLLPSILYACQIPLFFYGLSFSGMAILNVIWNLLSSILVTMIGIFYFKENISHIKFVGILLGLISLFLIAYEN
jgi:uncharacterized membrane protein